MTRILLVEADEAWSERVSEQLMQLGHDVDRACSIDRARALSERRVYDRMIVETRLPDGDGLTLLDWLRRAAPPVEVLLVSADLTPSLTTRAFLLGAPLVYKPVPIDVIRRFAAEPATASPLLRTTRAYAVAHRLSPRQTDLLLHLVRGTPRKALAPVLDVEENTIKTMVRQILEKTDAASLDELRCTLLERAVA